MKGRMVFVLCFVAMALLAAPALAAGPYVGVEAGGVFLSTSTFSSPGGDADLKSKTGFGMGLLGGFDFGTYRVEGEFAYRKNNNKEISGDGVTSPASGDYSTMALMLNGYYDFKTVSPTLYPYVGAGIGAARDSISLIDDAGVTQIDKNKTVFAYQLAVGGAYTVTTALTLDLGYKYFATAKPEFDVDGEKVKGEYASHNIFLGARYSF